MTFSTDPVAQPSHPRRPSARLRFGVAFLVGVILTLGLGAGALYAYDQQYSGRVLPGVKVGSVDLSGMAPDDAHAALDTAYHGYSDGRIVLTGPDGPSIITYDEIGRRLDTDALVDEALVVGRDGTAIDRAVANARTAFNGVTIAPRLRFDPARLADRIAAIAATLQASPVEASVTTDATTLAFTVVPGHEGQAVDATALTQAMIAQVARLEATAEIDATLATKVAEPIVSTAEATAASAAAERIVATITLVIGDKKIPIDTAKMRPWVTFAVTAEGGYAPVVDTSKISTLLDGMAAKVDHKAVNATFKTSGTKVTSVVASKDGYTLDVPGTAKQIEALLAARTTGIASTEIRPAVMVTKPDLTTAEATAASSKMKKISTWTTYFPISDHNGFGVNIWIPALTIDGYVVAPHATFDFWKTVGSVTRAKGYKNGGAIINGHTEPQGALAGGICSCSTTLFNAALRAGFKMGARRNHYYYIDRYPLGLDATVFQSGSGSVQTMSWTNDTDYPVLIRGYKIRNGLRGYVRFSLYSVPTGRKVTISSPTVKNIRYASDTIQYTSSLAPGATRRIEYPVDGKQVWRTVTVRDATGKIIHQTTYYSNYSRVNGITLVGKATTE